MFGKKSRKQKQTEKALAAVQSLQDDLTAKFGAKRWDDFSEEQRGLVILAGVVQVGLALFAQGNLIGSPREQVRGPKWLWFFGNFINFFGPIAFFLFGRRKARRPYLLGK